MEEIRRETVARLEQLLAEAERNARQYNGRIVWRDGRASYVGSPEGRAAWERLAGETGRIIANMPDLRPILGHSVMSEPDDVQRWCKALVRLGFA